MRKFRINVEEYHRTISKEFTLIKDRVRLLIGSSHWGEEGRYKEVILMNYLKKHLPENLSVGTGFVMNGANYDSISTQIDIIIYENNCPLIFKESDFVIVQSKNVVGTIEVKSKFIKSKFEEVLTKAELITELVGKKIFNGIFYYDVDGNLDLHEGSIDPDLREIISKSKGYVNHISFGENKFLKYWEEGNPAIENDNSPCISLYELWGLSFSYFLSNLIELTYKMSKSFDDDLGTFEWFLFPIDEGKENNRVNNISLNL